MKDADTPESGTITMELSGRRLMGVYAQFDPEVPDDPLFVCRDRYEQVRVRLARRQRARMFFGFPPVAYQQVANLLAAASSRAAH